MTHNNIAKTTNTTSWRAVVQQAWNIWICHQDFHFPRLIYSGSITCLFTPPISGYQANLYTIIFKPQVCQISHCGGLMLMFRIKRSLYYIVDVSICCGSINSIFRCWHCVKTFKNHFDCHLDHGCKQDLNSLGISSNKMAHAAILFFIQAIYLCILRTPFYYLVLCLRESPYHNQGLSQLRQ